MTARLKIFFHDNCFDGAASASLFSRFYTEHIAPLGSISFSGKGHGQGPAFSAAEFDADDHAIVDFRYAADERLGWWFDHHASAFQQVEDEEHYRGRTSMRFFYDAHARSCTKLLADSLARVYGWDYSRHADLVRWGDIIDGAQFESAAQATSLSEPALQVMTFIEHNHDEALKQKIIEGLTERPLLALSQEPFVQAAMAPVIARNARAADIICARVSVEFDVALLDVGDDDIDGYNKFLPYQLVPQASYVVAVSASSNKTKVSVGQNPWKRPARPQHIARICERYGGGGHAVVGAVTLPGRMLAEARRIAAEITEILRRA